MPIYKTIFFFCALYAILPISRHYCILFSIYSLFNEYIILFVPVLSMILSMIFSRFFLICFYLPLYSIYSSVFYPVIYPACFPPPPVSSGNPSPRYIVYFYFVQQNRLFVLCQFCWYVVVVRRGGGGEGPAWRGAGGMRHLSVYEGITDPHRK